MPENDQGADLNRYRIIPRVLIFIFKQDQVLLIKGAPEKRLWANKYNGIGGHVERGEDVLSAARRELLEETGIKDVDLRLCGTIIIDALPESGIGLYVFRGEAIDRTSMISKEGKLYWLPLRDLGTLPLVEDLAILLPKVASMKIGDSPFSARYHYDQTGKLQINFTD